MTANDHPVVAHMVEKIADLAGQAPDAVHLNAGIDSAVVLAAEAEGYLRQEIDADLFLRCPTIKEALDELVRLTLLQSAAAGAA